MSFPVFSRTECPLVPGRAWWVPASEIKPARAATPENSHEAIDALGITPSGPDNIPIVQHAMPCICPDCPIKTGEPAVQAPFKGVESPYAPGIKTHAVQSGRRSTILGASKTKGDVDWVIAYDTDGSPIYPNPENPEFYLRLKGCGMWIPSDQVPFPGITLTQLPSFRHEGIDTLEVRGTAFPKTATSDIINNPIINAMLEKFGLCGNNIPLGLWYYAPMDNDPAPNIPKVCNIMKTVADRRYESNLAAGLEIMIRRKLSTRDANTLLERCMAVYQRHGLRCPGCSNRTYMRAGKIRRFETKFFMAEVEGTTEGREVENLDVDTLISKGFCPSEELYEAIGDDIKMSDGSSFLELMKLGGRLGWEVGRCISIVHRAGFDWGTYQDHSSDGILDNAHANNLCVLPQNLMDRGNGRYQLLVPTDFDMSFRSYQVVDVWHDTPLPDDTFVNDTFPTEFGNMMSNVAGYTAALENVATGISKRDPDEITPQMDLIWVMRDIAVWEYIHAYKYPANGGYYGNDVTLEQALKFIPEALEATIDIVV